MSDILNITSKDIALAKQHNQNRQIMLRIVNREMHNICSIIGVCISGGVDIDESSNIRRTANITMQVYESDIINLAYLFMNYYIRLYDGIKDNDTMEVSWYKQGTFIINQNSIKFDKATRTLSFSLSDLMTDLTGDRAGVLHAYSSIAKNSQRIDDVMKNVLEICGIREYDITPICVYRKAYNFWDEKQSEEDFLVPYDLEFPAGVTAYDILDKLVTLYPNWEMFFDLDGKFICQRRVTEEDNSYVVMDDRDFKGLIISESISIDWKKVKNVVEVWGKEGKYYGEARDDNPESPFNVAATQELRMVETKEQIYDRCSHISESRAKELETKIENTKKAIGDKTLILLKDKALLAVLTSKDEIKALEEKIEKQEESLRNLRYNLKTYKYEYQWEEKTEVDGDEMAKEWAKQLLYENCRMQDSVTLECVRLPFLNNTGCKISYRSKLDNKIRTYVVKSISHSFDGNTTTINAIRFYCEQSSAYQDKLDIPDILNYEVSGMKIVVNVSEVKYAEHYNLYIDYKLADTSTGTTLSFELPDKYAGDRIITVAASAEGFSSPFRDETDKLIVNFGNGIETVDGNVLTTADDKTITIL